MALIEMALPKWNWITTFGGPSEQSHKKKKGSEQFQLVGTVGLLH